MKSVMEIFGTKDLMCLCHLWWGLILTFYNHPHDGQKSMRLIKPSNIKTLEVNILITVLYIWLPVKKVYLTNLQQNKTGRYEKYSKSPAVGFGRAGYPTQSLNATGLKLKHDHPAEYLNPSAVYMLYPSLCCFLNVFQHK